MAALEEKSTTQTVNDDKKKEIEEDEWEDDREEEEYHKNKLWQYVFPDEVSQWILQPEKCEYGSFIIIDVRDVDFKRHGLKIKNAINYPIHKFKQNVNKIVKLENIKGCDVIIFHCMFSQFRGPQCAQEYAKNQLNETQKVMVLEGGFDEYYRKYKYSQQKDSLFDKI